MIKSKSLLYLYKYINMTPLLNVLLFLLTLTFFLFMFFGIPLLIVKWFPKSKITKFIKKHIITDQDLESYN